MMIGKSFSDYRKKTEVLFFLSLVYVMLCTATRQASRFHVLVNLKWLQSELLAVVFGVLLVCKTEMIGNKLVELAFFVSKDVCFFAEDISKVMTLSLMYSRYHKNDMHWITRW